MARNTLLNVITPDKPMNIVIIGGSNTGLMNGIVLKRLGHNVHILEQNTKSERSDLAAGITTHPEFDEFMDIHDLVKEPWSILSPGIQWLNKDAAVTREAKRPLKMTSWGVIYHRLRANFDGFTSSFCANPPAAGEKDGTATFDLGKRVTGISDLEHGVQVTFEDILDRNKQGSLTIDLVILADGANSGLRSTFFPELERAYAGYVALRGTVPESEVSEEAKKAFDPKLTYFCFKNNYILLYIIPGSDGSLEPGHRRYNWVWYHPLTADSPDFTDIMTDTSGTLHRNTLPAGGMNLKAWSKYVQIAKEQMCTPFADVVSKTTQPFITAISDLSCPRAVAMKGRVLITGEALNLVRPHMALSTTASATQALLLEKVFRGEMSVEIWEKKVLQAGRISALKTNAFGTYFLYGTMSAVGWVVKLVGAMIGGMLPFSSLPAVSNAQKVQCKL
ncbi:hypothetical protein ONS95_001589 [Cadophora gregata]|uniref:uncharacterized protein n=1 Tax=Cadophora gregata TaxID=51156 RepID=UPI0026DB1185|nr:uncharacterized protein ONS95_001589 [Cadophora gregata]KAK0111215.1 hypothetical protein ONS95_001589 [Cadophora gregata]KAK0112313.1 hypothetical protein ONS96_001561 [Cadophora gregata f. sp. sojae]